MPSFEFEFKNTFDQKKIQEAIQKCKVEIQVGWPSGRQHVAAIHEVETDANGNKVRNKDGSLKIKNRAGTSKNPDTGKTIETWELARDLHYGTATIPARPFFDDAMDQEENVEKLTAAFKTELLKTLEENQKPNWSKIGVMAVGIIQEFIRSDYYKTKVPNAPSTIELKGSDTPLIDAADMANSLAFVVEE